MDMERMASRYRQVQRATVARSALDVIALIFLGAGFAFWGVAFWQLLAPPALLSLLSIQAAVLALVYILAAPLLLSMLVPTTPAGQLLQKTQWRTIGFPVIVGCAGFLTYQSYLLIATWLSVQGGYDPATGRFGLEAAGMVTPLAISLTIAFVVIPALAWVQLTPERWLQQIQQAHQVKKLELQQRGELAIIKASLVRAETLAAIGWANLLPLEQEEAVHSLRGLLMASSDSMRSVVRTLGISADLERDIMDDHEIADQLDYVTSQINIVPQVSAPALPREIPAEEYTPRVIARQDAIPAAPPPRPGLAGNAAPQRPAAPRSVPLRYATDYDTAIGMLTGSGWSVHALADVLGVAERTARDRLNAWSEQGLVAQSDTKGRFYFTERKEVR